MQKTCGCRGRFSNPHIGLFVLRVITGLIFLFHGAMSIRNLDLVRMSYAAMHLWSWLGPAFAVIELIGGLLLILGVWTCLVSPLLMLDMLLIIIFSAWPAGGWQSSEFAFLLIASLVAIRSLGAGRYKVKGGCGCRGCHGGANICTDCGHEPGGTTCTCGCHQ